MLTRAVVIRSATSFVQILSVGTESIIGVSVGGGAFI